MTDFQKKYLKYKNKYLNLLKEMEQKGGLTPEEIARAREGLGRRPQSQLERDIQSSRINLRTSEEEQARRQRQAEERARRQREAEQQLAQEQARRQREAEEQARRQREAEEQDRREQARRQAEERARRHAEEQARRQAEEQARRQREAEEQARRQREARRQAEAEARRQAEQQARDEEARRQREARRQAEAEARRQREAQERARRQENRPVVLFLNYDPRFEDQAFVRHTTLPEIIERNCPGSFEIKNLNFGMDYDILQLLEVERDDSIAHLVITTHGSVTSLVTGNIPYIINPETLEIKIGTPRFNQFSDILRRKLTRTASILFTACLLGNVPGRVEPDNTPFEKIKFTNCDYENFASKLSMQLPNIEIFCTPHVQIANEINLEKLNCEPLRLRYSSSIQSMYFYVFNGDGRVRCNVSTYGSGDSFMFPDAAPAPEHPLDKARCYNIFSGEETSLREYLNDTSNYPNKTNNIFVFTNGKFYCINIDDFNKKIYVPCIKNPSRDFMGLDWYYYNKIEYFGENPDYNEFTKIELGDAGDRYIFMPPEWPRLTPSQGTPDNFTSTLPSRFYNLEQTGIRVNKFAEKEFLDPDPSVRFNIDVLGAEHCNQRGENPIHSLQPIMDINAFLDRLPQ